MKRIWMVASSERAWKARLASAPSNSGDASPDAPPDASLHSTIQPFGAVWRFAAALWRRLGAPSRAPLLCWLRGHAGPVLPGGVASAGLAAALAGSFVVPAGSV